MKLIVLTSLIVTFSGVFAYASPECSPTEVGEVSMGLEARSKNMEISAGERDLAAIILADFQNDQTRQHCKKSVTSTGIIEFKVITNRLSTVVNFSGPLAFRVRTAYLRQ